ncbi:MAG: Asp-tRNA(Asn)/Glu-tRNA(Gln) amidotransferase GatCAB subunit C [candidate division Zixibacteria bacterium HGW-Zixibacteria-1]|nr:MAG: Asp-tRNA(Asn)/Glu-tRNA(Gln) amidotransferase GatCAB subunit C [candidate division Zixibacteria bacterium HGW-Zixibacteria-1]
MPVLKYDISRISGLARLVLIPEDEIVISRDLSKTLDFIDQIQGFDPDEMDHNFRTEQAENRLREDRIKPSLPRTRTLGNAPDKDEDFFRVPRVLG